MANQSHPGTLSVLLSPVKDAKIIVTRSQVVMDN